MRPRLLGAFVAAAGLAVVAAAVAGTTCSSAFHEQSQPMPDAIRAVKGAPPPRRARVPGSAGVSGGETAAAADFCGTLRVLTNSAEKRYVVTLRMKPAAREGDAEWMSCALTGDVTSLTMAPGTYTAEWQAQHAGTRRIDVGVRLGEVTDLDTRIPTQDYGVPDSLGRIRVIVRAVTGERVANAPVWIRDPSNALQSGEADSQGQCLFLVQPGDAQAGCGVLTTRTGVSAGSSVDVDLPGAFFQPLGELVTRDAEWDSRVRRHGESDWRGADVVDRALGRRFLYLAPGSYEVAYPDGRTAGHADVSTNARAEFVFEDEAGLILLPLFASPADARDRPSMLTLRLHGVSPGTSHPEGTRLFWMTASEGPLSTLALKPGRYQVSVEDPKYDSSTQVDLLPGAIRRLDVMLRLADRR